MRVLFAGGGTGGHLYPGLAIARALVRLDPVVQPFFVGARRGVERDVLPGAGFPFELLDLHPLYRQRPWENWRTLRGLVGAWRRIGGIVANDRPRAVVGTGGYAAGAVLAYAAARRIPYALQEQNSVAGLTVRGFSRRAREVYLGFPEAAVSLRPGPRTEIVDSGNPIEPPPAPRPGRAAARERWSLPREGGRVLLVTGGSQGARAVNEAVAAWIARGLPADLHVIWGTGKGSYDAFARHESARVKVRAYLAPIADAYAAADVALARAGAMTTAELCAWGLPMMLVPLPTAAADHQTANARALAAAGAAVHLPQADLDADALARAVGALLGDEGTLARMTDAALRRARPEAAETIARRVLALAHGGSRAP